MVCVRVAHVCMGGVRVIVREHLRVHAFAFARARVCECCACVSVARV